MSIPDSTSGSTSDLADALRLYEAQDYAAVQTKCSQLLTSDPNHAKVHQLLGATFARLGNLQQAAYALQRAVQCDPNLAEAWEDLAHLFMAANHPGEAIKAFARAISLQPDDPGIRCQLIDALISLKQFPAAETVAQQMVSIWPDLPEAHANLGAAFHQQEKLDEAIACYERAISLNPAFGSAYANLADALVRTERRAEAETAINRAVEIDPANAVAWNNRATVMHRLDRLEESLAAAQRAIELAPNDSRAHANAGLALLALGRFAEGWEEHEWRLRALSPTTVSPAYASSKLAPRAAWNGSPLNGSTIFLRAEGGFGDMIHFVRYAPLVRDLGGRVIVECDRALKDLIETADGVTEVIAFGESTAQTGENAPSAVEVLMMSLPHRFKTTLEDIPAKVPYLAINSGRADRLRKLLRHNTSLKVGLVWAGNPGHMYDRSRSCPLHSFSPLMKLPGIDWYSLQSGYAVMRDALLSRELGVIDLGGECKDFADLAAAMSLLDLIISVDTAPAHLAGALGLPVWTLLAQPAEWRWMRKRLDTPWYPTMRLFRQPSPGDWDGVMRQVADALVDRLHSQPI